jgi:hypothetical protein
MAESGKPVPRSSAQRALREELSDPEIKQRFEALDEAVKSGLNDESHKSDVSGPGAFCIEDFEVDDPQEVDNSAPTDEERGEMPQAERPDDDEVAVDKCINAELQFAQSDGEALKGKVKKRKRDFDGGAIGRPHKNPCPGRPSSMSPALCLTNPLMGTWPRLFTTPAKKAPASLSRCPLSKLLASPSLLTAMTPSCETTLFKPTLAGLLCEGGWLALLSCQPLGMQSPSALKSTWGFRKQAQIHMKANGSEWAIAQILALPSKPAGPASWAQTA